MHTVIDIKRPDNTISIRDLLMKLDSDVTVTLPNGETTIGYYREFELLGDRMVKMSVDISNDHLWQFEDEDGDIEWDDNDILYGADPAWYEACMDVEED